MTCPLPDFRGDPALLVGDEAARTDHEEARDEERRPVKCGGLGPSRHDRSSLSERAAEPGLVFVGPIEHRQRIVLHAVFTSSNFRILSACQIGGNFNPRA